MADLATEAINTYGRALEIVMARLDKGLQAVISGAATSNEVFNANVLINSQPAMMQALRDAGYYELSATYIAQFEQIPQETIDLFKANNLIAPQYTTADGLLFKQLAENDFTRFANIGEQAIQELRTGLVSDAVAARPFSEMVEAVRAATVGVDGKNSPLANHAYTHANTAILEFSGTATQKAGDSIGFDTPDSLWEVIGVLDEKTRDVCFDALNDPIRTRAAWEAAGYWGGTPGGWNCRHILIPYTK